MEETESLKMSFAERDGSSDSRREKCKLDLGPSD